jgi:hypothetical protein
MVGRSTLTSPDEPGFEVVGGWASHRIAADLLDSVFISPAALLDCPAAQVYRETLAGFFLGDPGGKESIPTRCQSLTTLF